MLTHDIIYSQEAADQDKQNYSTVAHQYRNERMAENGEDNEIGKPLLFIRHI
jgi:hypothetical protein